MRRLKWSLITGATWLMFNNVITVNLSFLAWKWSTQQPKSGQWWLFAALPFYPLVNQDRHSKKHPLYRSIFKGHGLSMEPTLVVTSVASGSWRFLPAACDGFRRATVGWSELDESPPAQQIPSGVWSVLMIKGGWRWCMFVASEKNVGRWILFMSC